jgi:hypothetical protein
MVMFRMRSPQIRKGNVNDVAEVIFLMWKGRMKKHRFIAVTFISSLDGLPRRFPDFPLAVA